MRSHARSGRRDGERGVRKGTTGGGPGGMSHAAFGAAGLALAADGGTRERTALSLQSTAGNRAVAASVADIRAVAASHPGFAVVGAPSSTVAPPPDGATRIANESSGLRAAGVTTLPAPGAPDLVVGQPTRRADGQWQVAIGSTTVTPDRPLSLYPGDGVHDMTPGPVGQTRHRHVTGAASEEIRRGEEEHLLDLEWARHLAYDTTATAINRVAADAPATGATADEARRAACDRVRTELPGQARWPAGVEPIMHWRRIYGALVSATRERDSPNRWHNMSTEIVMDPAAKTALNIPTTDELYRYVAGSTQVDQHPSEPHVRSKWDAIPMGPASAGSAAPATGAAAGTTTSEAWRFTDPQAARPAPGAYAVSIRRRRA